MSKLNATQEQPFGGFPTTAFGAALRKLTSILLVTALAGCATKGERASGLEHSSGGRGYNASAAHALDSTGLAADSVGQSSTQAGATGRRRAHGGGAGAGGAQGGPDAMDPSSSVDGTGDTGVAEDDSAADDQGSSLTDGGPGSPGKPGARGRRGRRPGHATAGAPGTSSDGAAGGDSAMDSTVAGADGGSAGGSKGRRGAGGRRRGASGSPGSGDESNGMGAEGDDDSDARIAAIEIPNSKVEVNEEYQPLTLGGALPVVLGVNEEGRFDFDQYALRDEVRAILDALAETLKAAEYDRLDILGYTDRIGTVDYNRRLSELRAYAVAQYLMQRGVPESKIRYEGRGDKDPLTQADECHGLGREDLITCLQKDRRVEIEASIHRKHATIVQ
jgi:outer membrane protein OmpA-like peptidoglycan-associated protein